MNKNKWILVSLALGTIAILSIGAMLLARRSPIGILALGIGIWYVYRTYRIWEQMKVR